MGPHYVVCEQLLLEMSCSGMVAEFTTWKVQALRLLWYCNLKQAG